MPEVKGENRTNSQWFLRVLVVGWNGFHGTPHFAADGPVTSRISSVRSAGHPTPVPHHIWSPTQASDIPLSPCPLRRSFPLLAMLTVTVRVSRVDGL